MMCTYPLPVKTDITDEQHKENIRLQALFRLNLAAKLIAELKDETDIQDFVEKWDDLEDELRRVLNAVNHVKPDFRADLPLMPQAPTEVLFSTNDPKTLEPDPWNKTEDKY
jgi:hypothetical protein